jgi:micrococcal nuclease
MYEYEVREIVKVVDGDTVDFLIDLGFGIYTKQRVRLNRIDAPETLTKDETEKKFGNEAKEYVSVWLINQSKLKIKTYKDDKYGRILADIFGNNSICLNQLLIDEGYAWEYSGDSKVKDFNLLLEKRNRQ